MSFGLGGGTSSQTARASSTTTTPWTNIANQLASTLMGNLKALGSGSSIKEGISALTASSERQTKEGIANIKEAFGKSGMRFSSDIGKNIADFQTGQTTALNTQIAEFQQRAVQNQLASLAEIIQLGSGSGTSTGQQTQHGSNFNWDLVGKLI